MMFGMCFDARGGSDNRKKKKKKQRRQRTNTIKQIAKMLSALTKKDRFSLFSSSSFTNKTKTIIQLSQMFSIE
jgi:hypothetical protein